eukprot:5346530-Prymnesium_polylepis.2
MGISGRKGGAFGLHCPQGVCGGPVIGLGGYPSTPVMAWEPGAILPSTCCLRADYRAPTWSSRRYVQI